MKISAPRAMIWQNLENLKALALANRMGGGKKVAIREISDKQLNTFLEQDLPEIEDVLDYLQDK